MRTEPTSRRSGYRLFAGVAVLLAFVCIEAVAGTTGKLSGRVTEKKQTPVIGANVVLTGTTLGAVTDPDGYYSILNIPPGSYEVQYRMVGYRTTVVKSVQITADNTTKLDAELQEEAVAAQEVVVTAQKPVVEVNLTSTVATVSDERIKALPVQDLQDIVNLQAGVVDGHFRGGRDGEVQYQVNGVSVNNPYDNSSSVKIDRSLIQEVQVITGTFDAEYGQAMSGVVNTVLKSGTDRFSWSAEVYDGDFAYGSGGKRGLTYRSHPFSTQSYQASLSGPVGLPQTYFLVSGRRYAFDDYFYAKRVYAPTDTSATSPTGDGKEVPLGTTNDWSGLIKLTNRSIEGLEISYQGLFDVSKGRPLSAGSFAWRLNPDGMTKQTTTSYVHGLDLTHVLSASTFYTLSLHQNYFDYTDWTYDNFYDPRYDAAGPPVSLNNYEYNAYVKGVDFGRFRQRTNGYVAKFSLLSQVTRSHQLKLGGEFQYFDLEFGTAGTLVYLEQNGVNQLMRFVDKPPDYPGVQYYKPISSAAYAQDVIEWNDLTIHVGARVEYFDARSSTPSDLSNPANAISGAPLSYPKKTSVKVSYAPRLGVSYPITTTSGIFFSYGHFYQLPPLRDMFTNANYDRLARLQAATSDFGVLGNPDVRPERTVQYEFGYKNAISDVLGLSINVFYKDIRDLLGVQFITTYNDAQYSRLTNVDFGNVTGFTISLTQAWLGGFSSSLDYTWQTAQGNSSNPAETADLAASGMDPRPRQEPFDWDQRNTLNASVELSQPGDYSVSAIVRFGSGLPYTPAIGSGFGSQIERNSGRKPMGLVTDVRASKSFSIGGVSLNAFLRIFNLFDATYFNGSVFSTTGSSDYSVTAVADRNLLANPLRYYSPRKIEIGIALTPSPQGF